MASFNSTVYYKLDIYRVRVELMTVRVGLMTIIQGCNSVQDSHYQATNIENTHCITLYVDTNLDHQWVTDKAGMACSITL